MPSSRKKKFKFNQSGGVGTDAVTDADTTEGAAIANANTSFLTSASANN